jgi:hypothetical protein
MDINRDYEDGRTQAPGRIEYVLDTLEDSNGFSDGIGWQTEIVDGLTLEELIGSVVDAEKHIKRGETDA